MSINCIELFAGAGGLMKGLELAGVKTILANEIHPDPCKTLCENFPKVPILQKDIKTLSGKDLLNHSNLKSISEIDLISGGPPCQGYSTAGLKDVADPRNTLIGDFIRIINEIKPRFFLLENVPGLIGLHKGQLFQNVLQELHDTGYCFHYEILYVADFGVPQMRKRLIIAGSRDGSPPPFPKPTHSDESSNNNLKPYLTCGEAIEDLPTINQGEEVTMYDRLPLTEFQLLMRKDSTQVFNHKASRHKPETMKYYALIPPGGTYLDIPKHLRKRKEGIQR